MSMPRHVLTVLLALVTSSAVVEAAAPPPIGSDRHGDPLPIGALARCGTVRLRTGGAGGFALSPDGKTLATGEPGTVRLWDAATGRERATIDVPKAGSLPWLEFTPDGKHLVAHAGGAVSLNAPPPPAALGGPAGADDALVVISLRTGKVVQRMTSQESGAFHRPQVLAGGKLLVAWRGNEAQQNYDPFPFGPKNRRRTFGSLIGWSLPEGKQSFRLDLVALPAAVDCSPDGKTVAFCNSDDGHVELWPTADKGDRLTRIPPPVRKLERIAYDDYRANALSFSEDGKRLTVGFSAESYVKLAPKVFTQVWDSGGRDVVSTSRDVRRQTARAHDGDVSADGKWWAQVDGSGVRLVDLKAGRTRVRWDVIGGGGLLAVRFSPDGQTLWTGPSSGSGNAAIYYYNALAEESTGVRAWQVPSGRELFSQPGHRHAVRHVGFADGGRLLLSVDDHGEVRLWRPTTGEPVALPDAGTSAPFRYSLAPDGKTLSIVSNDGMLRTWDLPSLKLARSFRVVSRLSPRLWTPFFDMVGPMADGSSSAVFDPTGRWLAVSEVTGGGVHLYDVTTGRSRRLAANANYYTPLTFSPDGKSLVTWGGPSRGRPFQSLNLWSVEDGKRLFTGQSQGGNVASFSPSGDLLAYQSETGGPRVYDVRKRSAVAWKGNNEPRPAVEDVIGRGEVYLQAVEFLRGGELVLAQMNAELQVREARTGQLVRRISAPQGMSILRTPAGPFVTASVDNDSTQLIDPSTGQVLAKLPGNAAGWSMSLSPDRRVLALTDGQDVRLHEVLSGGLLARMGAGHRGRVTVVEFSPDGKTLATGGTDTAVLLWDWQRACGVGDGEETNLEACWKQLLGDDVKGAWRAMAELVRRKDAAAFLSRKVRPFGDAERGQLRKLCEALDDDDFDVRQKAIGQLNGFGSEWVPLVKDALDEKPPLEVVLRLRQWRDGPAAANYSTEMRGRLRAVWVLEQIGTPAARTTLRRLEGGFPTADLTREARAASRRLASTGR